MPLGFNRGYFLPHLLLPLRLTGKVVAQDKVLATVYGNYANDSDMLQELSNSCVAGAVLGS